MTEDAPTFTTTPTAAMTHARGRLRLRACSPDAMAAGILQGVLRDDGLISGIVRVRRESQFVADGGGDLLEAAEIRHFADARLPHVEGINHHFTQG